MKTVLNKHFPYLFAIALAINIPGLFLGILDQDSALYASIAKTIVLKNEWLNLYSNGQDWLDKPHFPFWAEALSMKLFGINAFAYKLPSFLCWLLSCLYIYKTAVLIYDKNIARFSVIIFMTSLHAILANFDVRAEGFLTLFTIAATYYLILWNTKFSVTHFILAAVATALAVMTKGIFIGITIGGGLCWYLLWTNSIKEIFSFKYLGFILLVMVFCIPELYSLYYQFDVHPEKLVFNRHGVSGIRFFLWDSQFGRFFNTGPIKGEGDISFYLHTTAWAFLPWSLLFIMAVWKQFSNRIDFRKPSLMKYITGSVFISFLLFSFSKFQLPHYIVILFPHFALITSAFIFRDLKEYQRKYFYRINLALLSISFLLMLLLIWYIKLPLVTTVLLYCIICSIYAVVIWIIVGNKQQHLLTFGSGFSSILSVFLFAGLYPFLFQYQAGMQAGKTITEKYKTIPVMEWKTENSALLLFYAPDSVGILNNEQELLQSIALKGKILLYTTPAEADNLKKHGFNIQTKEQFDYFRITMLTNDFLNPSTREGAVQKRCLALICN